MVVLPGQRNSGPSVVGIGGAMEGPSPGVHLRQALIATITPEQATHRALQLPYSLRKGANMV